MQKLDWKTGVWDSDWSIDNRGIFLTQLKIGTWQELSKSECRILITKGLEKTLKSLFDDIEDVKKELTRIKETDNER